jgi:hypothetical protein
LISILAGAAPAVASGEILPPLLKPMLIEDETYTESFVAIADLDDGTYVKVQLGVSNAGSGDGNGGCRIFIAEKDKAPISKSAVVERDQWRWLAEPSPTLEVGACRATAKESLAFEASVDGVKISVLLDASAANRRAKAHAMKNGSDFYELEVLVPWAPAQVIIQKKGEPARALSGYGYADHSRANALPGKTAKTWVRFRALSRDRSRLVLVRFPPAGKAFEGWHWEQPAKSPAEITRVSLQPGKTDAKAHAWRVMLDGQGGPWRITSGKLIHRDAPIEERGVLGSMLGAVVGNPVTYTYRAVLEGKQDRSAISGIFEITVTDE